MNEELINKWLSDIGVADIEGADITLSEVRGVIEVSPNDLMDLVERVRNEIIREIINLIDKREFIISNDNGKPLTFSRTLFKKRLELMTK